MKSVEAETRSRLFPVIVAGLFFLSGGAGLIYEVAWTRMFGLVAGGTTRALTAVLVAYMGGLALGSYIGGRAADRRIERPLFAYGLIEGLIGVSAVAITLLIPHLTPVLGIGKSLFGGVPFLFDLYRFLLSALVMLVPTTLMGATFPIVLRGLLSDREKFGFAAGALYGINALGAMSGSLLAGFVLAPSFGLTGSVLFAAAVNLAILGAVMASARLKGQKALESPLEPEAGEDTKNEKPWLAAALLLGYGLSGLCAMTYQVGWARALSLSLGNSTYALGLIFASFIGGLSLGGIAATPIVDRVKRPLLTAALLEALIGVSAVFVMHGFEWITARMFEWAPAYSGDFGTFQLVRFLSAFALIFAPTFCMGALFPFVLKVYGKVRAGVGEPAGHVYAANTVGSILGAFASAHLLIRFFGVQDALLAATTLSLLIGAAWFFASELSVRLRAPGAGALAILTLAVGIFFPKWDTLLMNSGPYIYADFFRQELLSGRDLGEVLHDYSEVLYYREGVETTVSVTETRATGERYLKINGKTDASSIGDMPTQVLTAHVPMLMHPAPRKVMILGLASGVTAGSVLHYPIGRLDTLEISPAVIEGSRYFEKVSNLDPDNDKYNLIIEDARNYLALSDIKYDVILIEPTNPWVAGMSTLFTKEFYDLVSDSLEPGGLALMFIPAYDLDPSTMKMMLRTMDSSFAHVTLWESIPWGDYFVVGSNETIKADLDQVTARYNVPAIRRDLGRVGVHRGEDIFARFVMGDETIARVAGEGPLHVDDKRQLEYIVPKLMSAPKEDRLLGISSAVLGAHEPATAILDGLSGEDRERIEKYDRARDMYYRTMAEQSARDLDSRAIDKLIETWKEFVEFSDRHYPVQYGSANLGKLLVLRGEGLAAAGQTRRAVDDWTLAFKYDRDSLTPGNKLVSYHMSIGDIPMARYWAVQSLDIHPRDPMALYTLGVISLEAGKIEEAVALLEKAARYSPSDPEFRFRYSQALARAGKLPEAEEQLRILLDRDPDLAEPTIMLAQVLRDQGKTKEFKKYIERARELAPDHPLLKRLVEE